MNESPEPTDGFRLSPQQRHVWRLSQADGGKAYLAQCAVRIEGPSSPATLQAALKDVIGTHEILRTRYVCPSGTELPKQVIDDNASPCLDQYHLPGRDAQAFEARCHEVLMEFVDQHRELADRPPIKFALITDSSDRRVLLISVPALSMDAAGLNCLVAQICRSYDACSKNERYEDDPLQYADLAEWQNELLEGDETAAGRAFWEDVDLAAIRDAKLPPFPRPQHDASGFSPQRISLTVDPDDSQQLLALSQRLEVPVSVVLLTAWQTLLGRLTGQSEVVIALGCDGRNQEDLAESLGLFERHLPLRLGFDENLRFIDAVQKIRNAAERAAKRQGYFSWEILSRSVDKGTEPFCPIGFDFSLQPPQCKAGNVTFAIEELNACTDRFAIHLSCLQSDDAIAVTLHFDPDRYVADDIGRLGAQFTALLRDALAQPECQIADLVFLSDEERQEIARWNDGERIDFPQRACLHELIEQQAIDSPDSIAVVQGAQQITYRELNACANRLARHLRDLGVDCETLVGICVNRSLEMAIALVAIAKAGGAYLPMDPAYPPERLRYMLDDSRVTVLLTQQHLVDSIPESEARIVLVDAADADFRRYASSTPATGVYFDNLSYVIYTSGSTGKPKGVMLNHQGRVNNFLDFNRRFSIGRGDRIIALASLSFDMCAYDMFGTLAAGATIVMPLPEEMQEPRAWADRINNHMVSIWHTAPAMLQMLVDHLESHTEQAPRSLRLALLGGDWIPVTLPDRLRSLVNTAQVISMGGATECSMDSTIYEIRETDPNWKSIPYGQPMKNQRSYVLDVEFDQQPFGVPGELYLGGIGVGRGYFNRPEFTAQRFVPDPYVDQPGARMYRTGDLAQWMPDGNLELLGRMDHQVKIRGYRIELGEIESVLRRHDAVREIVVVARDNERGDKMLVAYLVAEPTSANVVQELRGLAKEKLPEYMVPSAYVTLDALPLTPNGKVDRRSLPAPEAGRPDLEGRYVEPRPGDEEKLAKIWCDVLRVERVGAEDNFFELGGHSLLATQVISRIRAAFDVDLPLRSLFEAPTVRGLADRVQAAGGVTRIQIQRRAAADGERALPLSFSQERLWFLDQLTPGSSAYNIPYAEQFQGPLNAASLDQLLREVVRRHEALRTRFPMVDGRPHQSIGRADEFRVQYVDLSGLSADERLTQCRRLATEEARRPFDLGNGPLLRGRLLRLGNQEHAILLTMHHVVSDGWSLGVLSREISALYEVFGLGQPSQLPELPIQYADYALWQRQWLEGSVLEGQLSYWKDQLDGAAPSLELPTDRPRPAIQTFKGASRSIVLPETLTSQLKALSQREGATLFMTLMAAFQILLHRYTGEEDILVGTPIAGRSQAEVEGLIGFFVNTLVMRSNLGGDPSFLRLLGQVRETALGAYAHQDLPFETLVDKLKVERDLSRTPLFQVMFALDSAAPQTLELSELTHQPLTTENQTAKFDLIFNVSERAGGLSGSLEYNTDLFEAATIERMLRHFTRLLEGIVAGPEQRVSELPLLLPSEQKQLMVEWNATETTYPSAVIHGLFEAQVQATPDRAALVVGNEQVSYAALNARANQLAHHLKRLGVGPQVLVGVCVERSAEMVVGLLAILKAGGAYVALDPEYPQSRLAFMVEDAQLGVLLTQHRLKDRLPELHAHRVYLDTEWNVIAGESTENLRLPVPENTLSHVIYTSGSTGRPKGVAIEHRSVVTLLNWSREHYSSEDLAGVLASTSICFDLSVWEFFVPLSWGGTVHVAQNALQLPELATANAVTLINTVPSAMAELVRMEQVPSSVRRVNLAGEPLQNDLVRKLYELRHIEKVCDLYGPSEDTTYSTFAQRLLGGPATIGRPIANTQAYLLSSAAQPVPFRASGELHLGGSGLARCYLSRPDLTAERFIPDPFGNRPGGRLYRTGDLARYFDDGNLEFQGRRDHQVKVRGFRIELGEIEAALKGHPSLRDAVVLARQDSAEDSGSSRPMNTRLVAYVVAERQPGPESTELRTYLKERLPDYMVPGVFVMLDALPLTPNGKLDRKALPQPEQTRPKSGGEFVAPRTREQRILASIWSDVLRVQPLGLHDNFFDLGGDSILSIQIVSKANQAGLRLSPRDIFQHQTVAELAAAAGAAPAIEAEQGLVTGPVPLTPIQNWFFERDLIDPHHFNQAILLEVKQKLDPHVLRQAIEHLLSHHDALRLRFIQRNARWEQRGTDPDAAVPFRSIDLSSLEGVKQRSALESASADLQGSLHLSDGPLLRVALFDLGPNQRQRLFLVIHHLAIDGVSWRILLEDLQTAYDALARGERVQLPAKTTSFAKWAARLQDHAQSPAVVDESTYWLHIEKTDLHPLPVDAAGENVVASTRDVSVSLSVEQTEALLKEVPKVYHTQINDVLLTAVMQGYASWTGQGSLLLDVEGHGREPVFEDIDVSRTVGWFTTLYPVLLQLGVDDSPGEALKAVKEQLRAVPNRGFNYGVLRYGKSSARFQGLPHAQVSFNYLGQFDQSVSEDSRFSWASESSGPVHGPRNRRPWLLQIDGYVQGGRLTLSFGYSHNVHQRETIERLSRLVLDALQTLISHCLSPEAGGATPSDFPLAGLDVKKLGRLAEKLAVADARGRN